MSNIRDLAKLLIERPERTPATIVMSFRIVTNLRGYEFVSENTAPPRGASWRGIFVIVLCERKIVRYESFPTQREALGFFRRASDELKRADGVDVVQTKRENFTAEFEPGIENSPA